MHRMARLLVAFCDRRGHQRFGYESIVSYAGSELGLSGRQTMELIRVGRRLLSLPKLDAALESGRASWTKVREVSRIAVPETEHAWAAVAEFATARQVEAQVRVCQKGDLPLNEEPSPRLRPARTRLVFDVDSAEAEAIRHALVRFKNAHVGQTGAGEISDGALLAHMCEMLVAAPDEPPATKEPGPRFQVVLTRCVDCAKTAHGEHEVEPALAATAECDHETVTLHDPEKLGHVRRKIPPATRRAVLARDDRRCRAKGCRHRHYLDIHHIRPVSKGGSNHITNLMLVCGIHHAMIHKGLWSPGVPPRR